MDRKTHALVVPTVVSHPDSRVRPRDKTLTVGRRAHRQRDHRPASRNPQTRGSGGGRVVVVVGVEWREKFKNIAKRRGHRP